MKIIIVVICVLFIFLCVAAGFAEFSEPLVVTVPENTQQRAIKFNFEDHDYIHFVNLNSVVHNPKCKGHHAS